jgi:hypothetical protein
MIEKHRSLTEERLVYLLNVKSSSVTIDQIRTVVFEGASTDFSTYLTTMLAALSYPDIDHVDDRSLQVIQDGWNYLPHRFLNGRCPADMMVELGRDINIER